MTNRKAPILILAAVLLQSALGQTSAIQPAKQAGNPSSQEPGAPKTTQDFEALARGIVSDLAARRFEAVAARFTPQMSAALPGSKLADLWDSLIAKTGAFHSIRSVSTSELQTYHVVVLVCSFENSELGVRVVLDGQGRFAGLNFVPATSSIPWTQPDYAHPESFTEQPITVGQDPVKLNGTLTLPNGKGPFPALVLVQGSGATDQDETVGPNKPFKDLAWGLASHGIAVLRYNKRTFQHPESFKGSKFTVEQESIEDARAGITLLAARPEVNPKKIFVVGHSLGAMLAPRIAAEDGRVAGIVIMAGITRPLEDVIVEQVKYEVGLAGKPTPQGDKQIAAAEKMAADIRDPKLTTDQTVDMLGVPMPGAYVLDLRAYDPAHTASTLKVPILVLQGARDCQVRIADYDGWKKALAGYPRATFHLYPNLYHLFIKVPASDTTPLSTPQDYDQPGHVEAEVVADIASWINSLTLSL
jgi:dienelactone hydrolase